MSKNKNQDNVILSADYIFDKERMLIPISPNFDMAIKGFYEGSLISLSGVSQCGKTSLALDFARKCQKPEYGNRDIYYYDIEARLGTRNLGGIDRNKFYIIASQPGKILSGEEQLQIAYEKICESVNSVHIIDSLGMMSTKKELLATMDESTQLGDINRLINKFVRKIAAPLKVNNNIVFAVNHVYANLGYGAAVKEKISSEVTYIAEYRLLWKSFSPWLSGGTDPKQIGQIMDINVIKSATSPPNQKITSYLKYEPYCYIDSIMELLSLAIDIGLIKKGGAWLTFTFLDGEPHFQGQDAAYNALSENPDYLVALQNKIKELIG